MTDNNSSRIERYSRHLFWDVDAGKLDEERDARFIIGRVLNYGLFSDWKLLLACYGMNTIIDYTLKMRDLDKKTVSFLSVLSGVPKSEFLCYNSKPSHPQHWNF